MTVVKTTPLAEDLAAFAQEVIPAILGTTRSNGSAQMNPVWYEYDGQSFWLNAADSRAWLEHLRRDPRVTLLLIDPNNMWRWAQIQGEVVEIDDDPQRGADHIDRLSERYLGRPYGGFRVGETRVKVRVEPVRVTGSFAWGG
jgi:PPOX class probable F420-dependent enzyme